MSMQMLHFLISYLKQMLVFLEDSSFKKYAFTYSLKRYEKVKTLPTEISVKLSGNDNATINSYLLFQRLIVLTNCCNISFGDCS